MVYRSRLLNKDCLAGGFIAVLGIGAIAAVRRHELGTLSRMGPGLFPTTVGAVMLLTGLAIAVGGLRRAGLVAEHVRVPDLRALALIPLSMLAFICVGAYAGLLPATFSLVFVAACADRRNRWPGTLVLATGMMLLALLVFWWALRVQFPLFTLGSDE